MQTQKRYSVTDSFRGLMAAVVFRALADLEKSRAAIKTSPAVKDEAMSWINGPDCEMYCLALDVDYTTLREKAAALYRRFLEKADGHEKASRKSGAGIGKPRTMTRPEGQPQSMDRGKGQMHDNETGDNGPVPGLLREGVRV
jgi:hypothetical protein